MSLILDALQRSERESELNSQVPGLHTRHDPAATARLGPGYLWFMAVVLLLLLALAVIGWEWSGTAKLPRQPESSSLVEPAVEREPEPHPVAVAPVVAPIVSVQTANDLAEVAALYEQLPAAQTIAESAGQGEEPGEAAAEPTLQDAEPVLDIDGLTAAARRDLQTAPVDPHPVPFIVELSQPIKDQIPSIFFRQHDWSSAPAASSVHLNSGVYRVGDTVAPGLRLVEILPDSIVLNYRGEEFRLRALNSWINL